MKLQKVSKRVISFLLIFVLLLIMLPLQFNNNKVYADDETVIDVTGLATGAESSHDCNNYLVTRYNESQHWKECSICGKHFDVHNHSFTEYWTNGNSCSVSNQLVHTCSCGYSYRTGNTRSHTRGSNWAYNSVYHVHSCTVCREEVEQYELHHDAYGNILNCKNPGRCVVCGADITSLQECGFWITDGNFGDALCSAGCGYKAVDGSKCSQTISYSGSHFTVVMNIYVIDAATYPQFYGIHFWDSNNGRITSSSYTYNSSTKYIQLTFSGDYYSQSEQPIAFNFQFYDSENTKIQLDGWTYFKPDDSAPTINAPSINYLQYSSDWCTQVETQFSGTENYCNSVSITLKDLDGNVYVNNVSVSVINNNWYYNFNPILESLRDKELILQATDIFGNTSSRQFTLRGYIDSKSPSITASGETSKDWTTSKTYVASATDDGVGNVQIAFNKLNAYATTVRNGNSYSKTYKFVGDVYGDTNAAIYYKDSVGNADTRFITISNIDNTAPTITDTRSESSGDTNDATVTVTANDVNTVLQKSGSGVQQYAISEINSANNLDWQGTNQLKVTKTGDYFVFARDLVGNVSSSRQVHVEVKSKYKVVHKLQNGTDADSTDYSTADTETFHAPINTMVTPATKTYRGFTAPAKQTVKVKNDGTTVVTYKYKRNHYKVHIDFNKGTLNGVSGTEYILNPDLVYGLGNWCRIGKPYRVGYDFVGYYDHDGLKVYQTINDKDTEAINGTKYWLGSNGGWYYQETSDMYLKAHYTPRNDTKYVINHYLMTVDGKAYALRDTDHKEGTSDKVITVSDYQKHYNGFTYAGGKGTNKASAEKPSQLDIKTTIAADGSRVINLYYTRNKYNLTVKPNGGTYDGKASDSVFNMFYQATKVMNKPSKKDCAFLGWTLSGTNESSISNNVFKMGYSDASLTANWSELPKFADVYSNVVYEGQTVTYNDLLKLVKATDKDYENGTKLLSIKVDKIRYCDNSEVKPESNFILDTASNKIGKLYVTYTTVDIKPSLNGITDTSHAETITVTYTRECEIRYNDLPSIKTEPYIYTYTGDKTLTEDTIESFVKGYVTVNDKQDDVDLIPWWNTTETKAGLRNSIEVVKVTDIQLDSAYVKDNADFAETVKNINSLKGIYSLKNTAPDAFNAITSYNVVFDVKDQWGKYTSGRLSNYAVGKGVTVSERDKTQTDEDRSILVICTKDSSYNNAYEGLRYVSSKYVNTVNVNSYWGDYGKAELNSVLKKRDLVYADENVKPTDTYVGTYKKKNGSSIYIQINDYTE